MDEFKATSGGKYRNIIVMLTDGESDEFNPASVSSLANTAKDKDIIVLTVGLGRDVDKIGFRSLLIPQAESITQRPTQTPSMTFTSR